MMPYVFVDEGGYRKPIEVGADRFRELVGLEAPGGGVQDAFTRMVMGGVMRSAPGADPNYVAPPASETWKRALSMGVDFAPGVGDVKALQEAVSGQNLITGEKLGGWERALSGAGALPFLPNVAGLMAGKGALKAPLGKIAESEKPFSMKMYRGEATVNPKTGYASDPGDFGRGEYWTSSQSEAKAYGGHKIKSEDIQLSNPLYLNSEEAYKLADDLYGTVRGKNKIGAGAGKAEDRLEASQRLTDDLKAKGYDGIVVEHKNGNLEVVRFPKSGLSLAEDLFKKGADEDAIWNQTGWRRDPKGNWAFEIDDSKANWKGSIWKNLGEMDFKGKLSDAFFHEDLFTQYPQLKDVELRLSSGPRNGAWGVLESGKSSGKPVLKVQANDYPEAKEVLIHEIQHAIQEIEGWPKGGSPDISKVPKYRKEMVDTLIADYKDELYKLRPENFGNKNEYLEYKNDLISKLRDVETEKFSYKRPWKYYHDLYGEFQARDAASRADWTTEQRKMVRPYSSEMEPKEGWIFR